MSKDTKVFDGYVRVSVVGGRSGERFQSPTAQRDAIERWAQYKGARIGEWHEDLDRSGGTLNRPGLQAILARIESGETGGIIVAKLDRLSRSVQDGIRVIEGIEHAGGQVVSIADDLDTSSANGKLLMHLMLSIGQWYRDTAKEQWAASQDRATERGAFPGRTPYGVRRLDDGTVELDPPRAAVRARMVRERAAGKGWKAIATGLSRDGIPTPLGGGYWAAATVEGIVKSEANLGVFVGQRGVRIPDAWPAMIDRATWDAAQAVNGKRTDGRVHQDRLIAGVARCASCRRVLKRGTNQTGQVSYGCVNRACLARTSISAALLDAYIAGLVDERLARLRMAAERAEDDDYAALLKARDDAQAAYDHWRANKDAKARLGLERHTEQLLDLAADADAANEALASHRRKVSPGLADLPADVTVALADLPWERRVQVCESFLHAVFVRRPVRRGPDAAQDVAYRTRVEWRDDRELSELRSTVSRQLPPIEW